MNCCCETNNTTDDSRPSPLEPLARTGALPGRLANVIRWVLPVTLLALMPKCPACVAAYVLLLTGVGLSFTAATALRWALIAFCIAPLAYLLLCTARRLVAHRRVT